MDAPFCTIGKTRPGGVVAVCDHASNRVPDNTDLRLPSAVMETHIAWDIGAAAVCEHLAASHSIPAFLCTVSRLVIDMHRTETAAALVPLESDGIAIEGNLRSDRAARLETYHRPYHESMAAWLDAARPALILAVHSFTPSLSSEPGVRRPWDVGLLYNQDNRAAALAMEHFRGEGLTVGDNQPYSGRQLNATMDRHAEAHGRPYCTIEIRNDLIAHEAGQRKWAARLARMADDVLRGLARQEAAEAL